MNAQQTQDGLIGLNLRDDQLRVVEVSSTELSRQVTGIAETDLRAPFAFETIGDNSAIRLMAEDIQSAIENGKFQQRSTALSIDSDFVLIKKLPVDNSLEGEELRDHVRWEVSQLMIDEPQKFLVDFDVLNMTDRTSGAKQLVVVTIRKAVVEFLREIFAQTTLRLRAIDVDVFSAQRVLSETQELSPEQKVALIDIRKRNLQISILYNGFYFVTEIPMPVEEGIEIGSNRDEILARVISKELRRIILDHKLGKNVEDLSDVFLYGDGVEDGMVEQLSQAHNVNLRRFNPFEKIPIAGSVTNPALADRPESFVISLGAALKGL